MLKVQSMVGHRDIHVYSAVDSEENQSIVTDVNHKQYYFRRLDKFQWNFFIVNAILLVASISSLMYNLHSIYQSRTLNYKLRQVNTFTPILEQLPLDLHHTTINGSLYNNDNIIYRQDPSPEVDSAWEDLARIKWFGISSSDVEKLGKDPKKTVRIPEEWGYGTDQHFASLDSQHLLHCLNTLRKSSFPNHAHYYAPNHVFSTHEITHLSHCTYLLMQALTCQPSLNFITHNWVEGQKYPFPDFGIERMCVKYEGVWGWVMERGVRYELLEGIERPEGVWVGDEGG